MVDYLPSTIESLRATILRLGLLNEGDLMDSLADADSTSPNLKNLLYLVRRRASLGPESVEHVSAVIGDWNER
jgi:hypothetical protein